MEHILNLEQVKKYYGGNSGNIAKAVDGISMYVDKGEFVAIMGASGSGKTTLLNCISTIDTVTSGHITVNNQDIIKITEEKQDYQEYVESFAHEIKIPIGALSLTFDNTKNYTLKKETDKIFQLVEQMLYYARSENTEKDYFVKQLQLEEVIHNVILKFRHSLMERKAIINIHDIENVIYTDEKWLTFILSQIVQNAIKYFDKQENKLTIYSQDNGTNILLVIEDNGCGIKASDLSRVFEKGFTGSNRNKANATGMGLYLSKKLCDRLGLKLDIASTEKEYTRLTIIFPKGTVHNFSE